MADIANEFERADMRAWHAKIDGILNDLMIPLTERAAVKEHLYRHDGYPRLVRMYLEEYKAHRNSVAELEKLLRLINGQLDKERTFSSGGAPLTHRSSAPPSPTGGCAP